jgi:hypothetical protein
MASNTGSALIGGVSAAKIASFKSKQDRAYAAKRQTTKAALATVKPAFLSGVPMHWMLDWPMPFPMLVDKAKDAKIPTSTAMNWTISASATPGRCSAIRQSPSPKPSASRPARPDLHAADRRCAGRR